MSAEIIIRSARPGETGIVLQFIRELAEYEHLAHEVVANEESLQRALFGPKPYAEVVFACLHNEPVGFALFFHNFSTFAGRPGIYLEDLFVRPAARGLGVGKRLLSWLAAQAVQRNCARLEWAVLDWNAPAIGFYEGLEAVPKDEWRIFRLTGAALERLAASS